MESLRVVENIQQSLKCETKLNRNATKQSKMSRVDHEVVTATIIIIIIIDWHAKMVCTGVLTQSNFSKGELINCLGRETGGINYSKNFSGILRKRK